MKLVFVALLIRSLAGTVCVCVLLSTIAATTASSALLLSAPFVSDEMESQMSDIAGNCWTATGRYFTYSFLLAIVGSRFYFRNRDRIEIEEELLRFDRAEIVMREKT